MHDEVLLSLWLGRFVGLASEGDEHSNKKCSLINPFLSSCVRCSCREKKDVEVHHLEGSKESEETELSMLENDNKTLRNQVKELKQEYARSLEFARKNNIELKPRNVPMNDVIKSE
eukprot:TCALIF_10802-PB protein Name:"Protein of unknown function" AED:0.40 eAED:0.40 QI:0/0/0/0.5/0/0/2/0/115